MQVSEEVLALYRNAYSDERHLPDIGEMKRLLERGNRFDVFNPYFPSDAEYWSFHENILVHADVEHALPPHSDTALGRHAKTVIGMLVAYGYDFGGYAGKTPDDVEFAVTESILFGEYEAYDISADKVVDMAVRNGLVKPSFAEALLALREVVEKERYPSPLEKARRFVKGLSTKIEEAKVRKIKSKVVRKIRSRKA